MDLGIIVTLAVFAVIVGWGISTYNGLVKGKNRVENAWAQIDVQLQRRHDLIPNLVETVKGYAAHEQETLDRVIAARNSALTASGPAETAEAEGVLTGALGKLFALSEAYPDLKANSNFEALQDQLAETENKVAIARQIYNDSVLKHNNRIETIPSNVVASMAGMEALEYFDAPEGSEAPPSIEF